MVKGAVKEKGKAKAPAPEGPGERTMYDAGRERLGKIAYEAFWGASGTAYERSDRDTWERRSEHRREMWRSVAAAVASAATAELAAEVEKLRAEVEALRRAKTITSYDDWKRFHERDERERAFVARARAAAPTRVPAPEAKKKPKPQPKPATPKTTYLKTPKGKIGAVVAPTATIPGGTAGHVNEYTKVPVIPAKSGGVKYAPTTLTCPACKGKPHRHIPRVERELECAWRRFSGGPTPKELNPITVAEFADFVTGMYREGLA